MRRSILLLSVLLLSSSAAFAQAPSNDSQTLQALLAEVRQLRQELQATTIAVQRAQILLYRVQTQEAVVARAMQRWDDFRSQLAQLRFEQKELDSQIKRLEEALNHATNPLERKEIEGVLPRTNAKLEALAIEEQQKQAKELDTREQLRIEQAKLADLQFQLDPLDQELQNASREPPRNPR